MKARRQGPGGKVRRAGHPFPALVATLFGAGRLPIAPGTWASLLVLLALFPLHECPAALAAAVAILAPFSVWSAESLVRSTGRRDPPEVVIDEALGMAIVLAAAPAMGWAGALAGFVAFRVFDVMKPPPLRALEKLPGGWGVVMDDVGAALYSLAVLWLAALA